jgi:peroxisomal membrane protein 4
VFLLLQKKLNGGKERDLDSLIAGGLGGWWVFGERTAVCSFLLSYLPLYLLWLQRVYSYGEALKRVLTWGTEEEDI